MAALPNELPPRGLPPSSTAKRPVSWARILLLAALLNAPLFFNGCEAQRLHFSVGTVVPCGEVLSDDNRPFFPAALEWWSWPRFLVNGLIVLGVVWLATRYAGWTARVANSRWLPTLLVAIAVAFNSWLVWPQLWEKLVLAPQLQLAELLSKLLSGNKPEGNAPNEWIWLVSSRLYYLLCIVGLGGGGLGVRYFLRHYFFVRTGRWWQIQLGGLMIVVVVSGVLIGMAVRLMVQH